MVFGVILSIHFKLSITSSSNIAFPIAIPSPNQDAAHLQCVNENDNTMVDSVKILSIGQA